MRILTELQQRNLLCEGAIGTQLQKHCSLVPLDLANERQPDLVRGLHQAYLNGGADILTTNTFRAVTLNNYRQIVERGIELARLVKPAFIALSIGPAGLAQCTEKQSDLLLKRFSDIGRLAETHMVDLLLLETYYDLKELAAVAELLSPIKVPLFVSLSLQPDGRTFAGESFECVIEELRQLKVDGIGLNCMTLSSDVIALAMKLRSQIDLPLIVQGNAGIPKQSEEGWRFPVSDQRFSELLEPLYQLDSVIIGGCCGTSPKTIQEIRKRGDDIWKINNG
ncbi:homocysteine S-methyltransferase family protein [Vagococcus sp. BWB3-3]|uniref:Homocysteine S-methyltransferase family protein n=1 Tax=Vagococcus allomyrinae TaxID=2794353 RepID=A0A940SVZ3_9ENTE|nr:homocysteine S-methyltransferase family protein [Vagococcus allomyrinae]MBP1040843.1 homocysteine S-methyltransferase family protein [Vagococcus allomyrinae]